MKKSLLTYFLVSIIKAYKSVVSPMFSPRCRFVPSCSTYSLEVIQEQGAIRGVVLSVKRLLKCHPFHPGGVDLAPRRQS
jgi:uncharacterized protein